MSRRRSFGLMVRSLRDVRVSLALGGLLISKVQRTAK